MLNYVKNRENNFKTKPNAGVYGFKFRSSKNNNKKKPRISFNPS